MKVYRGSAGAARTYVEADRSRVDDYYLAEGTGVAQRRVAVSAAGEAAGRGKRGLWVGGTLDGDAYEAWVAGQVINVDADTGQAGLSGGEKGRVRSDGQAVRFVEVVVNGPKTWSLVAALHPEIAAAYDAAQDRAAGEIIGWLAEHSTSRVGPRGRQVQVPVEQLEAAVVRHYTSRAGDPHRHLHLQINARVWAHGAWRGIHTVGVRDSLDAINGIGHAAVACDPQFRSVLAKWGYTLDPVSGEVEQLKDYAGAFSARAAQIGRNVDRYEAEWRQANPGDEPGPKLRRSWDARAWAQHRPDKVVPKDGEEVRLRWLQELWDLDYKLPQYSANVVGPRCGQIDRDGVVEVALSRLGVRRSGWNAADVRGEVEQLIAATGLVADPAARGELVEDLTDRAVTRCVSLLEGPNIPEHVRALTSPRVLAVEDELTARLTARLTGPLTGLVELKVNVWAERAAKWAYAGARDLDAMQVHAARQLAGTAPLLLVEGAAGAGKTSTLSLANRAHEYRDERVLVVAPTLKAAQVAEREIGTHARSAAWLIHQHGFRWDDDGHWTRVRPTRPDVTQHPPSGHASMVHASMVHATMARTAMARTAMDRAADLHPGDLLLVDEAGMLDQDTALALLTIADETGARVALVGDRHQLPAVGRGGVLDLAADIVDDDARVDLDTVHRFTDPEYADLTLKMRTGQDAGAVFDHLHARGEIRIHPSDVERLHHLATLHTTPTGNTGTALSGGVLVMADTGENVSALNAAIRDHRLATDNSARQQRLGGRVAVVTPAGEQIGVGDRVVTRRNDRNLSVANRQSWTVTAIGADRSVTVTSESAAVQGGTRQGTHGGTQGGTRPGRRVSGVGERVLPSEYVAEHVSLGYASTVYGAQGETVDEAHVLLGDKTGAASAYVAMTRGRNANTAHLVAESVDDAREQWVAVFARDRADLGPRDALQRAALAVATHGHAIDPAVARRRRMAQDLQDHQRRRGAPDRSGPGIGF